MSDEIESLKQQIKQLNIELSGVHLSMSAHMIKTQKDIDNLYKAGNELVKAVRLLTERDER